MAGLNQPFDGKEPRVLIDVLAMFPGRTVLYVKEVARALDIVEQHVHNLIEIGELAAINVGSAPRSELNPRGSKIARNYWRIPVSALETFVEARKTV